jgi:hypothetical protein
MSLRHLVWVLAVPAAALGCGDLFVTASSEHPAVEDFEVVWTFIDSIYPMFQEKGIDWDSVYARYRPLAEAARGDEWHQLLHDLVETLRDGHAYYQTAGGGVVFPFVSHRFRRDQATFSPYVTRRYFPGELTVTGNRRIEYGILEGNLGYLRLSTFDQPHLLDELPSVMGSLAGTDGLLIDIRNNTGGEMRNVSRVVGWFIDSPMKWCDGFSQREVLEDVEPPMQPQGSPGPYSGSVVVLINGAARSAGDLFAEVMRQLPRVTLVGDTTMGIACQDYADLDGDRTLPSGASIHIPTGCMRRYDGVPVEWFGVPPDIRITQTEEDIRGGRDLQLEEAIAVLKNDPAGGGLS